MLPDLVMDLQSNATHTLRERFKLSGLVAAGDVAALAKRNRWFLELTLNCAAERAATDELDVLLATQLHGSALTSFRC